MKIWLPMILILTVMMAGCATPPPAGSYEEQATVGGALAGGILGAVIGNNIGDGNNQEIGAAIGALLGGMAGSQQGRQIDYTDRRISSLEDQLNSVVVTIRNDNGSINRVKLYKTSRGTFVGPRGEEYSGMPTEAQLKPVYGLRY